MSLITIYESNLKRLRRDVSKLQKDDASDLKKETDLVKAISRLSGQAAKASSESSARSYIRQVEGKQRDLQRIQETRAKRATKLADTQASLAKEEQKLRDAQKKEQKKQTVREKQEKEAQRAQKRAQEQVRRDEKRRERELNSAEAGRRADDAARSRELADVRASTTDLEERLLATEQANAPQEVTVLFLAATPEDQGQLRIDKETREIQKRVRASEYRDAIDFQWRLARQLTDLIQDLSEVAPHILHFSGHGSDAELVFENAGGESTFLTNDQLGRLLAASSNRIRLIIFNSCNSADQAQLAVQHVDLAIGMDESIGDEAAKVFAGQFYASLGFGHSVQQAFEEAKLQMDLDAGEDHEAPRLFTAEGIDPSTVALINPEEDEQ